MSLLMEALRKAEEAKSKATKKDTSQDTAEVENTSAETPMADEKQKVSPQADTSVAIQDETHADTDDGPTVINPDPDEEEILAAHSGDRIFELEEMEIPDTAEAETEDDIEHLEFTPPDPVEDSEPATTNDGYFSEDDGLSLLQSTYFSRTQKPSNNSLEGEFADLMDDQDEVSPAPADVTEPAAATPPESPQEAPAQPQPRDETDTSSTDTTTGQTPETSVASAKATPADKTAQEKTNRDSASALFLAKEDSRKRRLKKMVSIAAIVLLFPLAGIVYWLFTSLNSSSGMQFNVQATGNLANRSFSDSVAQANVQANTQADTPEATAATNAPATTASAENNQEPVAGEVTDSNGAATDTPPSQQDITAQQAITAIDNAPVPQPTAENPVTATAPPQQAVAANTVTLTETAPASGNQDTSQQERLSFSRTAPEQIVNPDLNAAYDSYQQGDYAVASRLYQQVLQSEPNNRDALLHLASVNLKQNNPAMALNLYTRLLEINPRDPLARAGLLETVQGDPVRQEAELKALSAAYPDTAQLSFALGNLYASQNRWSEAQSAYFNALLAAKSNSTGPVSPDYAFNLAVSLERINQLQAALDYYREAKALSGNTTPGFSPAVLDQRLNVLEQRLR